MKLMSVVGSKINHKGKKTNQWDCSEMSVLLMTVSQARGKENLAGYKPVE